MLTSVAIILLLGFIFGWLFSKMKLPSLIDMILLGICIGPYALNILDSSLLAISSDIRQVALVIILTRAGLSLNIEDLKRVGRPDILMCFVPACFEMLGIVIFGPLLFPISFVEALVIGTVVAAVSTAVIVPRMISYTPKATVQASIGAIPLSMGLGCGELVVTVAVLSILLTAPLGALGIDALYKRLLKML